MRTVDAFAVYGRMGRRKAARPAPALSVGLVRFARSSKALRGDPSDSPRRGCAPTNPAVLVNRPDHMTSQRTRDLFGGKGRLAAARPALITEAGAPTASSLPRVPLLARRGTVEDGAAPAGVGQDRPFGGLGWSAADGAKAASLRGLAAPEEARSCGRSASEGVKAASVRGLAARGWRMRFCRLKPAALKRCGEVNWAGALVWTRDCGVGWRLLTMTRGSLAGRRVVGVASAIKHGLTARPYRGWTERRYETGLG